MRRNDREIRDRKEIEEIMQRCDVCRLALNDHGYPYVLPLNFGIRKTEKTITLVFHSALEGHKLDLMQEDPRASFEMDCRHQLQYIAEKGYCTFAFESVMGKGCLSFITEEQEKRMALQCIMDHYHPDGHAWFNPAAIPRTTVYQLKIETLTGKRKEWKR